MYITWWTKREEALITNAIFLDNPTTSLPFPLTIPKVSSKIFWHLHQRKNIISSSLMVTRLQQAARGHQESDFMKLIQYYSHVNFFSPKIFAAWFLKSAAANPQGVTPAMNLFLDTHYHCAYTRIILWPGNDNVTRPGHMRKSLQDKQQVRELCYKDYTSNSRQFQITKHKNKGCLCGLFLPAVIRTTHGILSSTTCDSLCYTNFREAGVPDFGSFPMVYILEVVLRPILSHACKVLNMWYFVWKACFLFWQSLRENSHSHG